MYEWVWRRYDGHEGGWQYIGGGRDATSLGRPAKPDICHKQDGPVQVRDLLATNDRQLSSPSRSNRSGAVWGLDWQPNPFSRHRNDVRFGLRSFVCIQSLCRPPCLSAGVATGPSTNGDWTPRPQRQHSNVQHCQWRWRFASKRWPINPIRLSLSDPERVSALR